MDDIEKEVAIHHQRDKELAVQVVDILRVDSITALRLVEKSDYLYKSKMTRRFTDLRFRERLRRTNPFLVRVRNILTVRQWAETQVGSALYASEEEAIGHVLEMIAKTCHPNATEPDFADDFDYQVRRQSGDITVIRGFQVKMSWDCMPMSSRKNLSNTIRLVREKVDSDDGRTRFEGIFAPCYGSPNTRKVRGQQYVTMRSREFWAEIGRGQEDFDCAVGEVCNLLFKEFRHDLNLRLIPDLVERLTSEGERVFGNDDGTIDFEKLFRAVNP
jgi:hypothetical protein